MYNTYTHTNWLYRKMGWSGSGRSGYWVYLLSKDKQENLFILLFSRKFINATIALENW